MSVLGSDDYEQLVREEDCRDRVCEFRSTGPVTGSEPRKGVTPSDVPGLLGSEQGDVRSEFQPVSGDTFRHAFPPSLGQSLADALKKIYKAQSKRATLV